MTAPIPMAEVPPFLNAYRVIAMLPRFDLAFAEHPIAVVLVHRPGHHQPFVTALWARRYGDSWDSGCYFADFGEACRSLIERSRVAYAYPDNELPTSKPHDAGSAPPKGFTRYSIELDVHDDHDQSSILEAAQEFAVELFIETDVEGENDGLESETISERVSVQRMEG